MENHTLDLLSACRSSVTMMVRHIALRAVASAPCKVEADSSVLVVVPVVIPGRMAGFQHSVKGD